VPVLVVADELGGVIEIGAAYDRQDRPEDLLLVDAHVGFDLVEHAPAEKKAVLIALQFEATAVDGELGALFDAKLDIRAHLVEMLACDERAHFGLGIGARADRSEER